MYESWFKLWRKHQDIINNISDVSFFLYDCDRMRFNLKNIYHNKAEIFYAVKANPLSYILKTIDSVGYGFDTASSGELSHVMKYKSNNSLILSTGPAKSLSYIKEAARDIDVFVIESITQLKYLDTIGGKALLRVQLPYSTYKDDNNPLGGSSSSQFGLPPECWINANVKQYKNVDIIGLHAFQWGNITDISQLSEIWQYTASSMVKIATTLDISLQVMDFGGGIGIKYCGSNSSTLGWDSISKILDKIQIPKSTKIWLELGRYAVGSYGAYITQIVDKKIINGTNILITDGGINHILRPAMTQEYFPVCDTLFRSKDCIANNLSQYYIYGPLCTNADFLGQFNLHKDIEIGDKLVFAQAGAYGFTESMPLFLCHNLPAEYAIYNGNLIKARDVQLSNTWMR